MTKLKIIQELPTPSEMAQVIPTIKILNAKIRELEKKVSRLEQAAGPRTTKTFLSKVFQRSKK